MSLLSRSVAFLVIIFGFLAVYHFLTLDAVAGRTENSFAGCVVPCSNRVRANAGTLFTCPQGDGDALSANGLTITVTIYDCLSPAVGIPASDFWVIGCNDLLGLCGGRGIGATGPTDENGQTTITGIIAAGGCDTGVSVVLQGKVIQNDDCGRNCMPIKIRSPDINGNLVVDLVDFAIFGTGYTSPPKPYNECIDFYAPFGTVTLGDFGKWASHLNHGC